MKYLRKLLAFLVFTLLVGIQPAVVAAAPLVDLGLSEEDVVVDCTAPARERRYSFLAKWIDRTASGTYYVKNGSACQLISDSLGPHDPPQQCSTNSYRSCNPRCTQGECRAQFVGCLVGRAAYLYVTATDGTGYAGLKFSVPACQ